MIDLRRPKKDWLLRKEGSNSGLIYVITLDTGIFLDHRLTRSLIREMAENKRFLNLFCYTGTGTVYAAAGGAKSSVSVDLSGNYLGWAKDNFSLNRLDFRRHLLVKADCREWIANQKGTFDLIFLDPPTFSNSKSMRGTWDVQRDYVDMLNQVSRLLEKDGVLLFSTNNRKFKLDQDSLPNLQFLDLSSELLPPDFARNPKDSSSLENSTSELRVATKEFKKIFHKILPW